MLLVRNKPVSCYNRVQEIDLSFIDMEETANVEAMREATWPPPRFIKLFVAYTRNQSGQFSHGQ